MLSAGRTAASNGEVTSRQSYDPWGAQLSGPSLEMGYLDAQQRRADPASGLIQMGARSYSPSLGRCLTEDPVFGHLGVGTSFDRYAYAWNNPLNFYDLGGRDVCVPTPFGDACAEDAAEDVGNAAGDVANAAWNTAGDAANAADSGVDAAWDWTAPGRGWIGERARDFWKEYGDDAANLGLGCLGGAGGAVGLLNLYSGGAVWIPYIGWVTQGGAAIAGCAAGATSTELLGFNPVRTR